MFRRLVRKLRSSPLGRLAGRPAPGPRPDAPGEGVRAGPEQLLEAVRAGDRGRVAKMLAAGEESGLLAEAGLAPLVAAARARHWPIAGMLAGRMDLEARQRGGDTALIMAAARGQGEFARLLLRAGARIDAVNDRGHTPLIAATLNGDADTLDALLGAGAPPDGAGRDGRAPLAIAAQLGREAAVEALLEAGADPDRPGAGGRAPLAIAVAAGREGAARKLLAAGAEPAGAGGGARLLAQAVERRMGDFARDLLSGGAEGIARPAVLDALRAEVASGDGALAGVLAAAVSADDLAAVDGRRRTLLMEAVENGRRDAARALVAAGADPDQRVGGRSAALDAAGRGDAEALDLLDELGADLHAEGDSGVSTLERAVAGNHAEAAALLIARGAPLDRRNRFGATALMAAVEKNRRRIARELLRAGADPNIANRTGAAPLHKAAMQGRTAMARMLVAAGADLEAADNRGRTPLESAHRAGHARLVSELKNLGAVDLFSSGERF